uniref:Uncharacterized protein n=1 Tax=viral metagenome TaxID=1070528 RepID=A0A6C0BDF6_9ZZZZ
MSDYRVYLKKGGDVVEIELPDIYKNSDSETYSDQIKTFISTSMQLDYYSLYLEIKRGGRILRNCKDIQILDGDEIYFVFDYKNNIDITKIKIKSGFNKVEDKRALKYDPILLLTFNENIEKNYIQKLNEVKLEIQNTCLLCRDVEIINLISQFIIFKFNEYFFVNFPIHFINNCIYFCNFYNKKPSGFGFMYDITTKTYYEGIFDGNNIEQGCVLKMSERIYHLTCQTFTDMLPCNIGSLKYLDLEESYDGFLFNGFYSGKGSLRNSKGLYNGGFIDGNKSGYGTMFYKNGDIYNGYWSKDKRNSFGKYSYSNGDYYSGVYTDDLEEEFGIMYDCKLNLSYIGTFKNGKRTFNKYEYSIKGGHLFYSDFIGLYSVKLENNDNSFTKTSSRLVFDKNELYIRTLNKEDVFFNFKHKSRLYLGHFDYDCNLYGFGRLYYDDNNEILNNDATDEEPYSKEYLSKKYKNYREYQCIFTDTNANGFGRIKYKNGDIYIGRITNGYKDGIGILRKSNGVEEKAFWSYDIKKSFIKT